MYTRTNTTDRGHGHTGRTLDDSFTQAVQRDTLYVAAPDTSIDSEWIVSYNTATGPEARMTGVGHVGETVATQDSCSDKHCETIDFRGSLKALVDPFSLASYLVSRMISFGSESRVISLHVSSYITVETIISAILISSNVVKLSLHVQKTEDVSYDGLIFSICLGKTSVYDNITVSKVPDKLESTFDTRSYQVSLIKEIFDTLVRDQSSDSTNNCLVILARNERLIVPAFKSVAVLETEIRNSPLSTHMLIDVQPELSSSDSSNSAPTIRLSISRAHGHFDTAHRRVVSVPPDTILKGPPTSIEIAINPGKLMLIDLTNTVLRIFMAGYAELTVFCEDRKENDLLLENLHTIETLLIVSKYFDYSFGKSGNGDDIVLVRKSSSVDPSTNASNSTPTVQLTEPHTFISTMISSGDRVTLQVEWTSDWVCRFHELVKLVMLKQVSFAFHRRRLTISAPRSVLEAVRSDLLAARIDDTDTATRGDVSPSNYRPTDCQIRFGSDKEIDDFEAGLDELVVGQEFSVLLVGPRNIGLGIRLLANAGSMYEFVSERAVRDGDNNTLKCAVRLFIRREEEGLDLGKMLTVNPLIVDVLEHDSRITIANQLFTGLNAAPPHCKYVLLKAKGDHCAFIAAMGVVVVNGWSRSMHQRVETRVALSQDTVIYITRLIPSHFSQ